MNTRAIGALAARCAGQHVRAVCCDRSTKRRSSRFPPALAGVARPIKHAYLKPPSGRREKALCAPRKQPCKMFALPCSFSLGY